ncbi:MAG: DUF4405 domain-containing protein [Rhodobacteraceae bacterium]|jgi:microcystin degradation protein MlrC|nr:DUF4405 domain-containing protein [Paracoccaceae bacterium]
MLQFLHRYATPLITGLFLVSLISGLALFLHIGPAGLHGMHEILSLLLMVPLGLHLWRNWRPFTAHFRRAPMAVALALSAAMALPFLLPADDAAPGGQRAAMAGLIRATMAATPAELAVVLHAPPEAVAAALEAAGIGVTEGLSLGALAASAGKSQPEAAAVLLAVAGG